jgi:hypothetical protein
MVENFEARALTHHGAQWLGSGQALKSEKINMNKHSSLFCYGISNEEKCLKAFEREL